MHKKIQVAVIQHLVWHLNGGLFDGFEYYAALKNFTNKIVYLVYTFNKNTTSCQKALEYKDKLISIFKDKYEIDYNIYNDIIVVDTVKIIRYSFDQVIIVDNHTYDFVGNRINTKERIFIVDPYIPSRVDYLKLAKNNKNIIYSELKYYQELEKNNNEN